MCRCSLHDWWNQLSGIPWGCSCACRRWSRILAIEGVVPWGGGTRCSSLWNYVLSFLLWLTVDMHINSQFLSHTLTNNNNSSQYMFSHLLLPLIEYLWGVWGMYIWGKLGLKRISLWYAQNSHFSLWIVNIGRCMQFFNGGKLRHLPIYSQTVKYFVNFQK